MRHVHVLGAVVAVGPFAFDVGVRAVVRGEQRRARQ